LGAEAIAGHPVTVLFEGREVERKVFLEGRDGETEHAVEGLFRV
jgi:hypothetical protein